MVGSALDGEDVVQEAIARAVAALARSPPDGADEAARRMPTRVALAVFMRLPPAQRAAVILKDVLGYANEEVAEILGTTLAAAKAALHRGRAGLRLFADEPAAAPRTEGGDLARLQHYIDRFNARDFDAVRTMLADDVRFDLVARLQGGRPAFENYFGRYAELAAWRLSPGRIDGRLVAIVTNLTLASAAPINVIDIAWAAGKITRLRDFFHAAYVLEGADIALLG